MPSTNPSVPTPAVLAGKVQPAGTNARPAPRKVRKAPAAPVKAAPKRTTPGPQASKRELLQWAAHRNTPAMRDYLAWVGGSKALAGLTPVEAFTAGLGLYAKFQQSGARKARKAS